MNRLTQVAGNGTEKCFYGLFLSTFSNTKDDHLTVYTSGDNRDKIFVTFL
jgi:hypothetical protein